MTKDGPGTPPVFTQAAPDSTFFPAADQLDIEGGSQLAATISQALSYGQPEFLGSKGPLEFRPSVITRVVDSRFRAPNAEFTVQEYALGGNGSIGLYYNHEGAFVGLTASPPHNASRTTEASEYASSAVEIGASLGIPEEMLSIVNVSTQSYFAVSLPPNSTVWNPELPYQDGIVEWFNYSLVIARSPDALNLTPTGCNALGLRYDNDTGRLLGIEAWRFVGLPATSRVTLTEAKAIARLALPSHFYTSEDLITSDGIVSLRLDSETLHFGYQYEALLKIPDGNSSYSVLLLVDPDNEAIFQSERSLPIVPWSPAAPAFPWLPLAVAFVLLVVIIGVCISISPEFAWLIMGSYLVLAYIRLKGAQILDNFNRGRIMGFISARPGASFTEIRDSLKIVNGSLAYHLSVLEKLELISSAKEGRSRRFFPAGIEYSKDESHFIGRTESRILEHLDRSGPLSNSVIAGFLGMSRQRTHYNLQLLQKRGLVDRSGSLWQVSAKGWQSTHRQVATGR